MHYERVEQTEPKRVQPWHCTDLWRKLEAMRIVPPDSALSFTEKLALENGWEGLFAEAVYQQYLRFLYLAADSEVPVSPSEVVDQAWHLHLTYSRHYWDELCGHILGRQFHHDPSSGGSAEAVRHRHQYRETLARYRALFASEPPADIWPPAERYPQTRQVRIDPSEYLLIKWNRRGKAGAALAALALVGACSSAVGTALETIVPGFIILFILASLLSGLPGEARRRRRKGDSGGCGGGSSDGDGGGCGGGCGGD